MGRYTDHSPEMLCQAGLPIIRIPVDRPLGTDFLKISFRIEIGCGETSFFR